MVQMCSSKTNVGTQQETGLRNIQNVRKFFRNKKVRVKSPAWFAVYFYHLLISPLENLVFSKEMLLLCWEDHKYYSSDECIGQWLGVFLPSSLDEMLVLHRAATPSIEFACTHLYTWVGKATVLIYCFSQENKVVTPIRVQTRTTQSRLQCANG